MQCFPIRVKAKQIKRSIYTYIHTCLFHDVASVLDFTTSAVKSLQKLYWKDLEENGGDLVKTLIWHLPGCVWGVG
jgi:hypothetical protein